MALVDARGLTKAYAMGEQAVHALRGVSVAIEAGEFVAIMGASGSGKSTLLNILGCLDQPTSGEYRLAGEPVEGMAPDQLASIRNRRIGFVFQHFNLLPRTSALENVELPLVYAGVRAAERRSRALEALRRVGLGERAAHTPAELSGGQQQRVAIARALVTQPQLILADEPTGALDSQTSEDIMRLLADLNRQGMTIVLVTHENDIAAWARRRIVFRDGVILEDTGAGDVMPGSSRDPWIAGQARNDMVGAGPAQLGSAQLGLAPLGSDSNSLPSRADKEGSSA